MRIFTLLPPHRDLCITSWPWIRAPLWAGGSVFEAPFSWLSDPFALSWMKRLLKQQVRCSLLCVYVCVCAVAGFSISFLSSIHRRGEADHVLVSFKHFLCGRQNKSAHRPIMFQECTFIRAESCDGIWQHAKTISRSGCFDKKLFIVASQLLYNPEVTIFCKLVKCDRHFTLWNLKWCDL